MPRRLQAFRPPRLKQPQPREDNRPNAAERGYCDRRHKAWRKAVLVADAWRCRSCGKVCSGPKEAQADHIVPIAQGGDRYDVKNGQCLCLKCHAIKTAKESNSKRSAWSLHPDWMPRSKATLTVVCGPPAAGKNFYIDLHRQEHDIVIDVDQIASQLFSVSGHDWNREHLSEVMRQRNNLLAELSKAEGRTAWAIATEPTAAGRKWWSEKLGAKEIIVIETQPRVCEQRIARDPRRTTQRGAAVRWWDKYVRRPGDTVIVSMGGSV